MLSSRLSLKSHLNLVAQSTENLNIGLIFRADSGFDFVGSYGDEMLGGVGAFDLKSTVTYLIALIGFFDLVF